MVLFIHFSCILSLLRETRVITSWPLDVETREIFFFSRFVFLSETRNPIWKTGRSNLQCSGSMSSIVNRLTLSCLYSSMDCTTSQIMRTFCQMMQSRGLRFGRLTKDGTFGSSQINSYRIFSSEIQRNRYPCHILFRCDLWPETVVEKGYWFRRVRHTVAAQHLGTRS